MHPNRVVTAFLIATAVTAALGVSGCAALTSGTTGGALAVPTPMQPVEKARDAVGAAAGAVKGLASTVESATSGK